MTPWIWRRTTDACAEAVFRAPALEGPFVRVGHRVWSTPGPGRFYRRVAGRLCERLKRSGAAFRPVAVEDVPLLLDVTEFAAGPLYFGDRPYEPRTARALRDRLRPGILYVRPGETAP